MSSSNKPWEVKETFADALDKCGSWTEMARYFKRLGYSVTEATIRRWADKHDLRVWYLEDKLKKAQDEVKELKTENTELKTENTGLKKAALNVRVDTIYITEKKNFWGKTKTSVDSTQGKEVSDTTGNK